MACNCRDTLHILWVQGSATGKGIYFPDFGIGNGTTLVLGMVLIFTTLVYNIRLSILFPKIGIGQAVA